VKSDGNTIKFGVIADTHIGSLYQRTDGLRLFYDRCGAEGVENVLHAGDVLAGWKVYRGQEFELHPDGIGFSRQRDMFEALAPGVKGIKTIFITGNHDASFKKQNNIIPGEELARVRDDWKFIGADTGAVTLVSKDGQKFAVQLLHPGGGTAYAVSYHSQKIIESLAGGQKPDLIAIGHYHKSFYMPAYRNVACLECGCWESQTPFMVQHSIAAHVGGWIITVALNDRKKLTSRIQAEWIGFFEEQK
jgi:UDP-2,3-diacylglucosamine pyrophosphatase LpxH